MLTISCINQKGGAGKTTIAVHLAAHAVAKGYRTLVIDLDTQASASLWGDRRGERDPDVVPEHSTRLERSLQAAAKEGYEVVIVDTAPNVDQAALKAAQASDRIIVPVRPATFDLGALKSTLDLVEMAQ